MNFTIIALSLCGGLMASLIAGALAGIGVGGKDLGAQLAGLMGSFYGLLSGTVTVALGLLILSLM